MTPAYELEPPLVTPDTPLFILRHRRAVAAAVLIMDDEEEAAEEAGYEEASERDDGIDEIESERPPTSLK